MDRRKKLLRNGLNPLTVSERVKQNSRNARDARKNRFNANRCLDAENTPAKPTPKKISQIIDKAEKLKAWRIQRNTVKFKEMVDQRSPFITTVPTGRWVAKKEPSERVTMKAFGTPVRKALVTEKVFKKSVIKSLVKSTVSKNNQPTLTKKTNFKKKILTEFNNIQVVPVPSIEDILVKTPDNLDSTFEISPEIKVIKKRARRSSLPEVLSAPVVNVIQKATTPPTKAAAKKQYIQHQRTKREPVKKALAKKPSAKDSHQIDAPTSSEVINEPVAVAIKNEAKKSLMYQLYNKSLETQFNILTNLLDKFSDNMDFMLDLNDETQAEVHKCIQQGRLILSDKLRKFAELLEEYEVGQGNPNDAKRKTDEDVENYWYLLYDEINHFKEDFQEIVEVKKNTVKAPESEKKRRTRAIADGTPRRSRRVAETIDSSQHNPSCYGCLPTAINTPRSQKRRRTTTKKSVIFFEEAQTPKVRKRIKGTPKSKRFTRSGAIDHDDDECEESELNLDVF